MKGATTLEEFVDPGCHVDILAEFHSSYPREITNVQEGGGFCSAASIAMDVATVGLTRAADLDITFHHWMVLELDHGRRYVSLAFFGNNKREFLFDESPEKLHERSHKVVKTRIQNSYKHWEWWGAPASRISFHDVFRFADGYIREYGQYSWGPGSDPNVNSCQSFCRHFEARYHNGLKRCEK